jgi:putative DNA methylase
MTSLGTNALASAIFVLGRKRDRNAAVATRREFNSALKAELPAALAHLQRGNIAPVDLAQAAIGPGMAVYTRYAKVVDAEGKALSVREALALINQTLDEVLAEQEGDFDADSRFAIAWFEQMGFGEGAFGTADVLARAKNTAVSGLVEAGIAASRSGKVRLLRPEELPVDWNPTTDSRADRVGDGASPDPRAGSGGRERGGGAGRQNRRQGRNCARACLSPVHRLRAPQADG